MTQTKRSVTTICLLTLVSIWLTTLVACAPTYSWPGKPPPSPRVVELDGTDYAEGEWGDFTTWACFDRMSDWAGGRKGVLMELGVFSGDRLRGFGFVLYDGTAEGNLASYERRGPNHRWDWGPDGNNFAFVLKPDDSGLFYDFSAGSRINASDMFKCRQR